MPHPDERADLVAHATLTRPGLVTHIRAGVRKLGSRTRTEAVALAFEEPR